MRAIYTIIMFFLLSGVSYAGLQNFTVCAKRSGSLYMAGEGFRRSECKTRHTAMQLSYLDEIPVIEVPVPTEGVLEGIVSLEDDGDTVRFTGVNVQIVNGTGSTGSANSLGNLIVGYNEVSGFCDPSNTEVSRAGSHNVVIGYGNDYSGVYGLVVGYDNTIGGFGSTVTGGACNIASGNATSVSGGSGNIATDWLTSILGGTNNAASWTGATVSGGMSNIAAEEDSTVAGGAGNEAYGIASSIFGGFGNTIGTYGGGSVIVGGMDNTSDHYVSLVIGGQNNVSSGDYVTTIDP